MLRKHRHSRRDEILNGLEPHDGSVFEVDPICTVEHMEHVFKVENIDIVQILKKLRRISESCRSKQNLDLATSRKPSFA